MKATPFHTLTVVFLLLMSCIISGQAPTLGTAANFVLFSSNGAITNTGISQVTGNVGSNTGAGTGFGNVNGVMESNNAATVQCKTDLLSAYNQIVALPSGTPHSISLGSGEILGAGTYDISADATMKLNLYLNGNASDVFIFRIHGTFAVNALSRVVLTGGALACNVFWKVEGAVTMDAGTSMKGTIIANNAAIGMGTGDTLEGRALSTAGAVSVSGVLAYTPIGCGSPVLTGPTAPNLSAAACYTIFSSNGPVTDIGSVSRVIGDVGTNLGTTMGYNPLFVTGTIHLIPDASTATCATAVNNAYIYLNALAYNIQLLYPTQLGNGLVLTPHTYWLDAAATLTDTLYLNAEGDANAVFVIQIEGSLTESGTGAKVKLINGAQSQNVYWLVNGAVTLNNFSVFNGTIICHNGAMTLNTGDTLFGRALTTNGAINTTAIVAHMPPGCGQSTPPNFIQPTNQTVCSGDSAGFSVIATGQGLTYQWRKGSVNLINGGNISGATSDTLTINPATILDDASNYNVIVSGTFPPNDTSANASLTVNPLPVANAGPDKNICKGDSTRIGTAAISGNTYSWSPSTGLDSSTIAQPKASPARDTTYILTVTDTSTGCKNADTVKVTVNSLIVGNAGPDKNICIGDSTRIGVPATIGNTYSWSPATGLNSSIVSQPEASPSSNTLYTLTVTNGSCSNTDTVRVTLYPIPGANTGPDQFICDDGNVQLGGPPVSGDTYMWAPATGLNSTIISQPTANPGATTTYTLLETDTSGGCSASNQVMVTVEANQFYDGFSPNGDGVNDWWDIPMLNCYPANTVTIINRWGSEVWMGTDYNNTSVRWGGENMSGENLPDGTYYYIIKYNNTEKRGWVFIKR